MTADLVSTLAGLAVILTVGSAGYFNRSIDRSGFVAGLLVGIVFVLGGGLPATFMLITFFLVGSAFTKYKYGLKEELGAAELKGGARTWKNVAANLFFPTFMLLVYSLTSWEPAMLAFVSSLAGALSDTLGSEIGVLSADPPIMIHTLRRVPPGTSGAISPLGTLASLVGALLIAIEAFSFSMIGLDQLLLAVVLGFSCSLVDSLLGAMLQVRYRCVEEDRIVEDPSLCNGGARPVRGVKWLDNHAVNLISTGAIALISTAMGVVL